MRIILPLARFGRLLAVLLAMAAATGAALAQEARQQLEQSRATLDRIEQGLQRPALDQPFLQELRGDLDPVAEALRELIGRLEPEFQSVDDRIKQLGDKPEEGATPEAAEITREREQLDARRTTADADLRQARLLQVRSGQLSDRLTQTRRDLFTRELFQRSTSVIEPTLWRNVGNAMPRVGMSLGFFVQDWFSLLGASGHALGFVVLALTVLLAIVLYWPLRKRLLALPYGRLFAWGTVERPTAVQRSIMGAWSAVVNALLPAAAAFLVVEVLQNLQLLPSRFEAVAQAVVFSFMIYNGVTAIADALLEVDRPAWRFLPVSDAVAARAMRTVHGIGLVGAVFYLVAALMNAIVAPLSVTVALHGVRGLVFAAVLALGLASTAAIERRERREREADPFATPETPRNAWRWLRLLLWLGAFGTAAAALVGYAPFGTFLSGQVIWALIVLGALVILLHLCDDALSELTRSGSPGSRRLSAGFGIGAAPIEQIGIVVSGALRVTALAVAVFLLVAPWGIESRDALGWVRAVFFGVEVGGIRLSVATVLLAVTIFVLGLLATRAVQRWLEGKYLPSTRLDMGLRDSIRTAFGYVGFIIAALVSFSFLGIDIRNFAIVAGALSVGIGFGLQSIVSNFVSGLILLAERPIKAGDLVSTGGVDGYVRRVNVRATQIETFDKAVLIVPNSTLVTGTVKNWMHDDILGKATVRVGVPYGSGDPDAIRTMLVDIAREHDLVAKDSEPKVSLVDFLDGAMVFELAATVNNVDKAGSVRSDLRFEIVKRLNAAGIPMK